jgi:hypothetical protein
VVGEKGQTRNWLIIAPYHIITSSLTTIKNIANYKIKMWINRICSVKIHLFNSNIIKKLEIRSKSLEYYEVKNCLKIN